MRRSENQKVADMIVLLKLNPGLLHPKFDKTIRSNLRSHRFDHFSCREIDHDFAFALIVVDHLSVTHHSNHESDHKHPIQS